jgi:hypothetical protein
LEEFLHCTYTGFLGENVFGGEVEGFFRAPFYALWFPIAEIADMDYSGFRMKLDCAIIAGFNTPTAAVAFLFVDNDGSFFFGLFKGIAGAGGHTGGVFAEPAGDCDIHKGIESYSSDA